MVRGSWRVVRKTRENMGIKSYKDLEVWQKSVGLVDIVYKLTQNFPKEEAFGLVSQMRRSSVSIPSNISEGFMRQHTKEMIQ